MIENIAFSQNCSNGYSLMGAGFGTIAALSAAQMCVRSRLRDADPVFRRTWLHLFVDKVVITGDEVKITGPVEPIVDMAKSGNVPGNQVPNFAREWRATQNKTVNTYLLEIQK